MNTITLPPLLRRNGQQNWRRTLWLLAAGVFILSLLILIWWAAAPALAGRYLTEAAVRADLVVSITATGSLRPTRSVDVGSELSGTLAEVLVEENERIRRGQILARLDSERLDDALAQAEANVLLTQATLEEARSQLQRLQRLQQLSAGGFPAPNELDAAQAAVQRAQAARQSASASLRSARSNRARALIRSPIDGYVLSRRVEPGQTVAAAMTTPVLFTLAEDLTQMELEVRVDEADIGAVHLGQEASFTVAAWPGRRFAATLQRVGIGSTLTDNVVTYKTILSVPNKDQALRPGMTATARIITARRPRALLVSNAALRFVPPALPQASRGSVVSYLLPRAPPVPRHKTGGGSGAAQLWLLQDGAPQPIPVTTGASDGRMTEIKAGAVQVGTPVIVEYQDDRP